MAALYKPQFDHGGGGVVDSKGNTIVVKDADGNVIYTGNAQHGSEGSKFQLPVNEIPPGSTFSIDGGAPHTIEDPTQRMEYSGSGGEPLRTGGRGSLGSAGSQGTTGVPGQFTPGGVGTFGAAPAYIGDLFPKPKTIKPAPYTIVDPLKFSNEFIPAQRDAFSQNFDLASTLSLKALDTEFAGLSKFATQATELRKGIISGENLFNQAERTSQVNAAVPDVVKDLNQQAEDFRAYARGEVPNSVVDRGLEIGVRSEAADIAATSGFGVRSSAARKVSDLMSARERIQLSQYGNQALAQNEQQRTDLFLAPTQYSAGGSQINVNPTVSASQLQQSIGGQLNNATLLSPETAFTSSINQSQFLTNLIQGTREFNATNVNNFALTFFNYLNSYANSVAGAGQLDINTQLGLDQQEAAADATGKAKRSAQKKNAIKDGLGLVGSIIGGIAAFCDSNLKKDISESTLSALDRITVYDFKYKENTVADDGDLNHTGVMAQELQKVFPECVKTHESGYLQVNLADIVFILMKAVKELSQRVKE